jgi:hypothetical protein
MFQLPPAAEADHTTWVWLFPTISLPQVNINLVAYRPVEVGAFYAGYGLWG